MPDVSRQQQKAMYAAKEGKSTLGIPQKVGAEFVAADKAEGNPKLPLHVRASAKARALRDENG